MRRTFQKSMNIVLAAALMAVLVMITFLVTASAGGKFHSGHLR